MAYRGQEYKAAPAVYAVGDIIIPKIGVRQGDINKPISVFVKFSAGAPTSIEVYESIDGVDWRNATEAAAYQGSTDWTVVTFSGATYPAGTLLQIRCKTAGITVDRVIVVQDW